MLLGMVAASHTWALCVYNVEHPSCDMYQKRRRPHVLCGSHLNDYILDILGEIKYVFEPITI